MAWLEAGMLPMRCPQNFAQWLAYVLLDPAASGLIPRIPDIFSEEKIVHVAEVNQSRCLNKRGRLFENVD